MGTREISIAVDSFPLNDIWWRPNDTNSISLTIKTKPMTRTPREDVDPRMLALARAVEADLGRAWTVPALAGVLGITAGHLRRIVKHAVGATPRQWLCNLRLEHAARLLADPSLRVKEVQWQVGITDASHFTRDFRDRFGMCPTEFRLACLSL